MFDIFLVFVALKWVGAVNWTWSVVFIPLWIALGEMAAGFLWAWWSDLNL